MDVKLEQLESKTSTPGVTELMVGAALDQRGGGGEKKENKEMERELGAEGLERIPCLAFGACDLRLRRCASRSHEQESDGEV